MAPRFSGAAARQDPFGAYPPEPLDGGSRKPHEPSRFRPALQMSPDGVTGDLRDEDYREIERLPRERQKLEESVRDAEVRDQEDQRGGALR